MRYYVIDQFTQRVMYATDDISGVILNGAFVVPVHDEIEINESDLTLGFTQPNTVVSDGLIDQIRKATWSWALPRYGWSVGSASTYMYPFLSSSDVDTGNSSKINIGKCGTITVRQGGVLVTTARGFMWSECGDIRTVTPLFCMGRWVRSESNKDSVSGSSISEYTTSNIGPVKFWHQFTAQTSDYWCTIRVSVNGGAGYSTLSGSGVPVTIPVENDGVSLVIKIENNTSRDIDLNWFCLVAQ